MSKINKPPFAVAMGVAVISTFAANANAETNPFGMTELSQGYMQLAEAEKAGEMACGANMNMEKPKAPEGACAGKKTEAKPAPATDAKAGEAKCGAMMDGDKMKKGMENACGAMMKGKEGACGTMSNTEKAKEGACGEAMKQQTPATQPEAPKTETK